VELKPASAGEVPGATSAVPRTMATFVEVPLGPGLDAFLDAVASAGASAKVRTGGVTPDGIPAVPDVARFLDGCVRRRLAFKATAGLHHPVRSEQPLTYAADAPRGVMHGFLNLFLAAAALVAGGSTDDAADILQTSDPRRFAFASGGVDIGGRWLDEVALWSCRNLARSFGSCSFAEPVADLRTLGLLPA